MARQLYRVGHKDLPIALFLFISSQRKIGTKQCKHKFFSFPSSYISLLRLDVTPPPSPWLQPAGVRSPRHTRAALHIRIQIGQSCVQSFLQDRNTAVWHFRDLVLPNRPDAEIHGNDVWARGRPGSFVPETGEMFPAPFMRHIWSVRRSTVLSEDAVVSICFCGRRQHTVSQHLGVGIAVDFDAFVNEDEGGRAAIGSHCSPDHDSSGLLAPQVGPASFRKITGDGCIHSIVLRIVDSLHSEDFLIWPDDALLTGPLNFLQHLLSSVKSFFFEALEIRCRRWNLYAFRGLNPLSRPFSSTLQTFWGPWPFIVRSCVDSVAVFSSPVWEPSWFEPTVSGKESAGWRCCLYHKTVSWCWK